MMELSFLGTIALTLRALIYSIVPIPFVVDLVMTFVGIALLLGII
ncbi:MAG: NADH-quinone oxidoreductase subunit H, partial [Selenomonas massiliensis]